MNLLTSLVTNTTSASGGGGGNPFEILFGHVLPHKIDGLVIFGQQVWNIQIFQVLSILLIFGLFAGVAGAIRRNATGRLGMALTGFVCFIRDEMVYPYLGEKDGNKLLPLFLSTFFFVLFMNMFGLVPFGATATASVYVPAALALITFMIMLFGGMIVQGPIKFWMNLVPHGVPLWLWPLMFLVEIIGLLVKPFALMVRLTANMTGGHLVLLSFMGLAFYFGTNFGTAAGLAITPVSIGMSVFIMIIEGFVALLQAYIFTLLSIIFVSQCLHPDH